MENLAFINWNLILLAHVRCLILRGQSWLILALSRSGLFDVGLPDDGAADLHIKERISIKPHFIMRGKFSVVSRIANSPLLVLDFQAPLPQI